MPIAFYCRAKPQDCDAFTIFEEQHRVFIGYPLHQIGVPYDPQALHTCLVDPTCPEEEWQAAEGRNGNHSKNRNFIRRVKEARGEGAIVLIPRPNQGVAYLGRIIGPFEIVDAPHWGEDYLCLREQQGLDRNDERQHHIADVAQGWPVDGYQPIALSRVPGWIRCSLFGRSTYGEFRPHPLNEQLTAYEVLDQLLEGPQEAYGPWTLELEEIKQRLVDTLDNPSAFENLIVSLLQLEYPNEIWRHTGGPGDGGIDGLGSNEAGETVGLMQAKFRADTAPELSNLAEDGGGIRRYAAIFLPENPQPPADGTILLNLAWITCAVRRHWRYLPLARTIRVGNNID